MPPIFWRSRSWPRDSARHCHGLHLAVMDDEIVVSLTRASKCFDSGNAGVVFGG